MEKRDLFVLFLDWFGTFEEVTFFYSKENNEIKRITVGFEDFEKKILKFEENTGLDVRINLLTRSSVNRVIDLLKKLNCKNSELFNRFEYCCTMGEMLNVKKKVSKKSSFYKNKSELIKEILLAYELCDDKVAACGFFGDNIEIDLPAMRMLYKEKSKYKLGVYNMFISSYPNQKFVFEKNNFQLDFAVISKTPRLSGCVEGVELAQKLIQKKLINEPMLQS